MMPSKEPRMAKLEVVAAMARRDVHDAGASIGRHEAAGVVFAGLLEEPHRLVAGHADHDLHAVDADGQDDRS